MVLILFFFFKQKTAYEMRISDWSSDVCSSDLRPRADTATRRRWRRSPFPIAVRCQRRSEPASDRGGAVRPSERSEEHTSELQSLMRSSYAVFCLKKKTQKMLHMNTSEAHNTQLYATTCNHTC